mgnify:CR=1 FL=1
MIRLVLAGDHQQYLSWLARLGRSPGQYQPIDRIMVGRVLARDVGSLDQVGEYWLHPAWGNSTYRDLMAVGVALGLPWALPWDADFLKAKLLREAREVVPVTAKDVAAMRAAQEDMERRLAEGV